MPSNLSFNAELLQEALILSGLKYKKDVIDLALNEYIQHHKQQKILDLFYSVPYDENYNYKVERKSRSKKKIP